LPALLLAYLVLQHKFPSNRGGVIAVAVALIVAIGMAFTLTRRSGLRLLRFVTLIPVVLIVAAILRLGAPALDATLSARPNANDISSMETKQLPTAVFDVSRETDYGLAFYHNQIIAHYEWGQIPSSEHILIALEGHESDIAKIAGDRRVSHLGGSLVQHLDYY